MSRNNSVPSLSQPSKDFRTSPLCQVCGVPVERLSRMGPERRKHGACRDLTRWLRATERAIAEVDWQETPEGIEARRQMRARLLAVANRIAPVDWERPRDEAGRFVAE